MANINNITLTGNLTVDPDLNYSQDGTPRCNFSIAVNEYSGDNEKTSFVPIVCWGRQAENAAEYLSKGSSVGIEGRLRISQYEDNDGNNRKYTQVVARMVHFINTGNKSSNNKKEQTNKKENDDMEDPPFTI